MNYGGLSPGKGALHCHGAFGRIDSEQKDTTMNQATSISSLLVNQLKHPFGVETPSFSWKLASARQGAAQAAYRIRVFAGREGAGAPVWDSGEVASGDAIAIRYGGAALKPASAYSWTVAVKDETGAWTESAPAVFETALYETPGSTLTSADLASSTRSSSSLCSTILQVRPLAMNSAAPSSASSVATKFSSRVPMIPRVAMSLIR